MIGKSLEDNAKQYPKVEFYLICFWSIREHISEGWVDSKDVRIPTGMEDIYLYIDHANQLAEYIIKLLISSVTSYS